MIQAPRKRQGGKPRWLHRPAIAIFVLIGLLAAAACGSDNDDEDSAPDPSVSTTSKPGLTPVGQGVRGVTDTTISVGVWYWDTALAGFNPPQGYSSNDEIQKVVKHINANGGIAGRQLVVHGYQGTSKNATTASGREQQMQEYCAMMTEDKKVFAMMAFFQNLECARKSNTVLLNDLVGYALLSEAEFPQYKDLYYAPSLMLSERRGRNLVEGLVANKTLTKDAKVAVVGWDNPMAKAGVNNGIIPALAKNGIQPALQITYPDGIESPWQNYVVQMQSAGINFVLFSDDPMALWAPYSLIQAAENQKYYPKWGLTSDNVPNFLAGTGKVATQQLVNVHAIGYLPTYDGISTAGRVQLPNGGQTVKTCGDIFGGWATRPSTSEAFCELLFFLQSALNNATEISPSGLSKSLDTLGNKFESVRTHEGVTTFSNANHAGPTYYRNIAYDKRCRVDGWPCFEYVGDLKELVP